MRRRAVSLAVAACAVTLACSRGSSPAPPDAGERPPETSAPALRAWSDREGEKIVEGACLSCHSGEMLAQQRLSAAQWRAVVLRMVEWGALLDAADVAPLTAWLSARYGPDAGAWTPARVSAAEAAAAIAPVDDGPFSGGDAGRGRAIYVDRCSGCHGMDGLGHIGPNLRDRPLLYRAVDFADTVRRGRGKMPPIAMTDGALADVLAHLRRRTSP